MSEHNIKANSLQINEVSSLEEVRIAIENLLSYAVGLTPTDDFDLVPKWYVDRLASKLTLTFLGSAIEEDADGFFIDLSTVSGEVIPEYPVYMGYINEVPLNLSYRPAEAKIYGFEALGTTEEIKLSFV